MTGNSRGMPIAVAAVIALAAAVAGGFIVAVLDAGDTATADQARPVSDDRPNTTEPAAASTTTTSTTTTTVPAVEEVAPIRRGGVMSGDNGSFQTSGAWSITNWHVNGDFIRTPGARVNRASPRSVHAATVPVTNTTRAAGTIVLTDNTEPDDWVIPIELRLDGTTIDTGTITIADPYTFDIDTSDGRRLDIALGEPDPVMAAKIDDVLVTECLCIAIEYLELTR